MRIARALVSLATVGLACALVASWIPAFPFVLFEHFRVQYVVLGMLVVGAAAGLKLRGYFDAAAIALVLHALPVLADLGRAPRLLPRNGVPVRVLSLNVLTANTGTHAVRTLIETARPDVIGLVEVNQRWLDELAPSLAAYPGRLAYPAEDNFGVALFARGPVTGTIEELGAPLSTIVGEVSLEGVRLTAVVAHLVPPMTSRWADYQTTQRDGLASRVAELAGPVIVMGDFNATPWSRTLRGLVARTGLCDTRAGFGVQASWHAAIPFMRIPIDHVLASCSIGVRDRRIGPDVGSDHFPVIVDLVVPRAN
ncbi:MAG: endonuclease/exonuclease/phosphatase family protein [Kofleriaceae bacterium]|nr:endonuclease/exonuclease/phosphatase family protein [Kofleriaceae bacterium]